MGRDSEATVSLLGSSKGSDDETTYMDAKWGNSKWRKSTRMTKGRARKMAMGAASIINSWPDHVLFCWLAAVAFGIVMFASVLMFLGMAKPNQYYSDEINRECLLRRDRKNYQTELKDFVKMPIHLHLILNDGEYFRAEKYRSMLTSTLEHHPGFSINVYILLNDTDTEDYQRNSRFKDWELYNRGIQKYPFFETDSTSLESKIAGIPKLPSPDAFYINSNIKIIHSTFSNYFEHSPLRFTWKSYPRHLFPLIFKVLTLWEHGGIALPWKMFTDKIEHYATDQTQEDRLKNLVQEFKKQSISDSKLGVANQQDPIIFKETIQNVVDFGGIPSIDVPLPSINIALPSLPKAVNELPSEAIPKVKKYPTMDDFIARGNELLDVIDKPREEIAEKFSPPKILEDKISHLKQLFKDYTDESYSDTSSEDSDSDSYGLDEDGLPESMESHSEELLQVLRKGKGKKKTILRKKRSIDNDFNLNLTETNQNITNPEVKFKISEVNSSKNELDSLFSDLDVELSILNNSISILDERLIETSTEINQILPPIQVNKTLILNKTMKNNTNVNQKLNNTNSIEDNMPKMLLDQLKTVSNDSNDGQITSNNSIIATSIDEFLTLDNLFQELMKGFDNMTDFNITDVQETVILSNNASDLTGNVLEAPNFILIFSDVNTEVKNPFEELTTNEEITFDTYKIMKDLFESIPFLQNPLFMLNESKETSWESNESWELNNEEVKNQNHFHESKKFRDYAPFNHYNIFSHPLKDTINLDRYGYYMAVRRPCHAFLGQVIKSLVNKGKYYEDPEEVVPENLKIFCQGKKLDKCLGVSII